MRRTALKPGKPLRRTRMAQKPTREPAELTASKLVVDERSGGMCEIPHEGCEGLATGGKHHRKHRRHGDHSPANLLNTCRVIHPGWIHEHPELAYHLGWLLHEWQDPELVPVLSPAELAAKLRFTLALQFDKTDSLAVGTARHRNIQEAARMLRLLENQQDTA